MMMTSMLMDSLASRFPSCSDFIDLVRQLTAGLCANGRPVRVSYRLIRMHCYCLCCCRHPMPHVYHAAGEIFVPENVAVAEEPVTVR